MSFWENVLLVFTSFRLELFTSMLSGATCGLIGCFVILRRMALIGDALSHSILPGVVIAFMLAGTGPLAMFLGAMLAGFLTTLCISFLERHNRVKEDSAIGVAFAVFFAVGIILISSLPRGTHFDLKCYLFGNPLAVQPSDLEMMMAVGVLVCASVILFYRPLFLTSFDPIMATTVGIDVKRVHYLLMSLLAATVVASLLTVGVIMVVAMIIAPGLVAYQLTDRLPVMLVLAFVVGAVSAGLGFVVSFALNWPPGPTMTVVAGILFLIALFFSPKYGVLFQWYRHHRARVHFLEEDILKYAARHYPEGMDLERLAEILGVETRRLLRYVRRLVRRNMVSLRDGKVALTGAGKVLANEVLRAHRLWESYLAHKGIDIHKVHDIAEALEHAHQMADELDDALGSPKEDPHGKEIPPKTSC